ncbi:formate dehydrogenase family accessory protein FdhD [Methanocaldococcus vulcanius M7]|uniref:Formate dehydrogenase family accessory protein FdhD n=1 Tax=Methanocaldococcus vulcanius (strain ATCC 700851 / DSM 12094 / M7) TaxID=579137 RepID=C9RH67_METVM|nr:formate dehydrogenase accessory sulfurtransferase FdhD [Methanocaldococcus vulcanius]ACX72919.1 formate dehydrogenase family accessory protein FdhD [Methanocaldococcus vulcanius M7]
MIKKIKIKRFDGRDVRDVEDYIAVEESYNIFINEEFIKSISLSPNFLNEFAVGFAISEGFLNKVDKVEVDKNNIYIFGEKIKINNNKNNKEIKIDIETLKKIISYKIKAKYWEITGSFHWASIFDLKGNKIIFVEDIGRYNAVDKVIGYAILNNYNLNEIILKCSGRIPYEIVKKAINSGLNIIISKSPPTDRAIELAEKNNILLIGFARNGKFNIYTSEEIWER